MNAVQASPLAQALDDIEEALDAQENLLEPPQSPTIPVAHALPESGKPG